MSTESSADQEALETSFPGFERDLTTGWVKEGTRGAEGMPLNVQVIARPWQEEKLLRIMKEMEEQRPNDYGV